MKPAQSLKIWFVDDLAVNRTAWLESFATGLRTNHEFAVFATVEALFEVLDAGQWPDILFIDYFIGPRYGHEVLDYFRRAKGRRPVLIAHSSDDRANQGMLREGADLTIDKLRGAAYRRAIKAVLASEADLQALIGRYRR